MVCGGVLARAVRVARAADRAAPRRPSTFAAIRGRRLPDLDVLWRHGRPAARPINRASARPAPPRRWPTASGAIPRPMPTTASTRLRRPTGAQARSSPPRRWRPSICVCNYVFQGKGVQLTDTCTTPLTAPGPTNGTIVCDAGQHLCAKTTTIAGNQQCSGVGDVCAHGFLLRYQRVQRPDLHRGCHQRWRLAARASPAPTACVAPAAPVRRSSRRASPARRTATARRPLPTATRSDGSKCDSGSAVRRRLRLVHVLHDGHCLRRRQPDGRRRSGGTGGSGAAGTNGSGGAGGSSRDRRRWRCRHDGRRGNRRPRR